MPDQEARDPGTPWVLHVDLDQFIAAVEVLRHPELRGRPVVVGGDGDPAKRGVVSTASYEAREYGVHSGLPLRTAARRCPDAVFLPVDREEYEAASATVMEALRGFGAVIEVMGWDEAFVAVDTDDPEGFARGSRPGSAPRPSSTATVGIGQNKLQAKLATGFGKPAGVFRLTHENWFDVLGGRPTDALWGIGAKTARKLAALGIETVRELAAADPEALAAEFGRATGPWLVRLARGQDTAGVERAVPGPFARPGGHVPGGPDDWEQVRPRWPGWRNGSPRTWWRRSGPQCGSWSRSGTPRSSPRSHSRSLPGPTSDRGRLRAAALGGAGAVPARPPGPAAGGTGRVRRRRLTPGRGSGSGPRARGPPPRFAGSLSPFPCGQDDLRDVVPAQPELAGDLVRPQALLVVQDRQAPL